MAKLGGPAPSGGDTARDHLANERTLLAWLRTAVAVMALGFVVARFGLLLRELGAKAARPSAGANSIATVFGTALVIAGGLMVVLGVVTYVRRGRAIEEHAYRWSPTIIIVLAAVVVVVSILLATYLLLTA